MKQTVAPTDEAGLALLEVLIGGALLAIALVGIALMFSEGRSYVLAEGDDRVATALARQKIERIRALGFGCIPLTPVTPPASDSPVPPPDAACLVDAETDAARTYNETSVTEATLDRYVSRQTTVVCADPSTMTLTACPDPPTAKLITVDVLPRMAKATSVRVETFLTAH